MLGAVPQVASRHKHLEGKRRSARGSSRATVAPGARWPRCPSTWPAPAASAGSCRRRTPAAGRGWAARSRAPTQLLAHSSASPSPRKAGALLRSSLPMIGATRHTLPWMRCPSRRGDTHGAARGSFTGPRSHIESVPCCWGSAAPSAPRWSSGSRRRRSCSGTSGRRFPSGTAAAGHMVREPPCTCFV